MTYGTLNEKSEDKMKEVTDIKLIDKMINKNDITSYLKSININFRLYKYEKGEMLIEMMEKPQSIKFVVKGAIKIYGIRNDGSILPITYNDEFNILGDIELCNDTESQFFVEAKNTMFCLEIPMEINRQVLLNDNCFLRFLLKSISGKMILSNEFQARCTTLEGNLLYYMKEECEDNTIKGIEHTAFLLKSSRRQLQRVLKKLVEENVIDKVGKGCYKLKQ